MTKTEITEIFEDIARLLEIKGENPFKIRAYTNAARTLDTFAGNLQSEIENGTLTKIDGIGKAIAEKIEILMSTGELPYYTKLRASFPPGLLELFDLQGLGGKKIKVLWDKLNVTSIDDLEGCCKDGRVAALNGFGAKTAENLLKAIEQRQQFAGKFLYGDIVGLAEDMLEELRNLPSVGQAEIAGSYRRKKEIVGDLDFIISSKKPEEVSNFFVNHPLVKQVLAHGKTKSSAIFEPGIQCDLRVVQAEEYPFALNYFTGSKEHNIRMRSRALTRGWSLNEYRFSRAEDTKIESEKPLPKNIDVEENIYHSLGLDFVPPELREDRGEFEQAESHTLPKLIEWQNLRGVFHNHTIASDGKNTLKEMAEAAAELGFQYIGVADHSKSSFQANGLDEGRLLKQVDEVAAYNAKQDVITVFSGVECDILKDGSLDFSDDVLARLDYVVASVHSSFTLSEKDMTERLIRAISNPNVKMLGHLTGRLLLSREPYTVNIPAVLDAAAETGTFIELNASRYRLDMDWRWWGLAKEKGVKCVINPDAHSVNGLQEVRLGINIARKGGLRADDVINCLPLDKIRLLLKKEIIR
ncbi:MAG: DNA polymerase/3'-5' exonuclease PolX [Chthoniobacterales bacterium]